jgi:hypothetical protein
VHCTQLLLHLLLFVQYVIEAIRRAITLKPGDVFYDLGCGADGAQAATNVSIRTYTAHQQLQRADNVELK